MASTETAKYYRTTFGKRKHASLYCANARRAIRTGYPTVIPANEVDGWAPCGHCCTAQEISAFAAPAAAGKAAKAETTCRNSGVVNPRRVYSECRDCGKSGKVLRSTGSIRGHQPQPRN